MQLTGKSRAPYVLIIIVLSLIACSLICVLTVISFKGLESIVAYIQATATVVPENQYPTPTMPLPSPTAIAPTPQDIIDPTPPNETEGGSNETDQPGAILDPEIEETMNQIESQVRKVRGLDLNEAVPRRVLTPEELRNHVNESFLEDFDEEESKESVRNLALIGLFPKDLDMRKLLEDLYSEQIAGFYDDDEKQMYVVAGGEFGIRQRITHAHEYTHALQFANYDIENKLNYNEDSCKKDSERCLAIKALIEGDASFTELKWFEANATHLDALELLQSLEDHESPVLDSIPSYLSANLMFPYTYGSKFVEHLYDQNGYDAVNEAFTVAPPISTEQIMFPERYPDDTPQSVELGNLASAMGNGWEETEKGVIGAWDTFSLLSKGLEPSYQIDESIAMEAAEGWGGDAYMFLRNTDLNQVAYAQKTVWDSEQDSQEAYDAFTMMLRLRFDYPDANGVYSSDGYYARVFKTGENGFVLIFTESLESLESLSEALSK